MRNEIYKTADDLLDQLPIRVFFSDGDGGVARLTVYTEAELVALEALMQAQREGAHGARPSCWGDCSACAVVCPHRMLLFEPTEAQRRKCQACIDQLNEDEAML